MQWTQTQAAMLMRMAEAGALSAQRLAAAQQRAPLQPGKDDWQHMAKHVLALAGALLLAAGVVFFFAYNWANLHYFAKLALAVAALAVSVLAGCFCQPRGAGWRAAVFAAMLCCGALLALIGQTYQTGADIWELFAAWAALALPLALLSGASVCWALWLVVFNAALWLALVRSPWLVMMLPRAPEMTLLLAAGCNLLALAVLEATYKRLLAQPQRHVLRLAALGVVLPLMTGSLLSNWMPRRFDEWLQAPFLVCVAGMGVFYYGRRRDIGMLAMACHAAIAVLVFGWLYQAIIFLGGGGAAGRILILAVLLIVLSGAAAVWLARLHAQDVHNKGAQHG